MRAEMQQGGNKPLGKPQKASTETVSLLEFELEKLKGLTGLGRQLSLLWHPSKSSTLSGKVENDIIFIFDDNPDRALETLRHEFLDFAVTAAIKPYEQATMLYQSMVNAMLRKVTETAYAQKERVIEALIKLLSEEPPEEEST